MLQLVPSLVINQNHSNIMNMQMEDFNFHALIISLFLCLSFCFLKVYQLNWRKPKELENSLKQQGIKGTPFTNLKGDLKEYIKLITEAWSKPLSLSHQIAQRVDPFTQSIVQKYGKVSFFWLGTTPKLIIIDPRLIKEVLLNKQGHFQKPPLNPLITILTKGLTTLEGEKWAEHRRMINPAFHLEKLMDMIPSFVRSSTMLINKWTETMVEGESLEVDMWPEFQELTGDIISQTAFGSKTEDGNEIIELQRELLKLVIEAMQSLYLPGFRFIPTKKNRRRKELDQKITSMFRRLVVKGKEEMLKKRETREGNILSLLLQYNNEENQQEITTSTTKNSRMTVDEIIEECKLFYIAGHETTASLLTWTIIVLAMHPDWQQKAREEVLQLCGDKDPDSDVISHLKIVNIILYEVLRLYPPVIALYQHAYKKTKIGNLNIQAGIDLILPILLVNRDPELWGEDADEFKPERFSEGISKACKDQGAFLPFGWGPRTCIGQTFAMIEAKVALIMILKHFSFELSASYTHAPYTVMTLQPQHGAPILLNLL